MMLEQYLPQTYADDEGTPRGGWRSATDTTGQTGNQRVKRFADPCPSKRWIENEYLYVVIGKMNVPSRFRD